ncbi:hypothetical protein HDR61_01865 [bacterium]|nr:hypothetical protein [bacterium]
MTAVNDSQKKVTVHDEDVRVINGMNVYVDRDGNVIRTERRDTKRKSFAAATDKLNAKMPDKKELSPAEIMALQSNQND